MKNQNIKLKLEWMILDLDYSDCRTIEQWAGL